MTKERFDELIKRASQPLESSADKSVRSDDYSDKQTRSRTAEDTSAKPSGKSRPKTS